MAAAVPFALKAGAMIGGSLLSKKLSGPSKQQQAAMTAQQQGGNQVAAAGGPLLQQGAQASRTGSGYLQDAGNYYRNILSNRVAASQSLAPEMTTALDYYKGAGNKVQRTMSGGSRDYAQAELDRQKVGQMAGMLPLARRSAAEGAAGIGGHMMQAGAAASGQGVNALTSGGYLNSNMFNQATTLRNQEQEGGKNWGGMLYDLAGSLFGGGGKSGGSLGVSQGGPGMSLPGMGNMGFPTLFRPKGF